MQIVEEDDIDMRYPLQALKFAGGSYGTEKWFNVGG